MKFKLQGKKHNLWPLFYTKTNPETNVKTRQKHFLEGDREYDSEQLGLGVSVEEIKKQLRERIVWTDEKETPEIKPEQ